LQNTSKSTSPKAETPLVTREETIAAVLRFRAELDKASQQDEETGKALVFLIINDMTHYGYFFGT
jgi:hypothetical protein